MNIVAFLGSVTTILSFVAFVGIVLWAYNRRRSPAFDAAANAPFALPDEMAGAGAQAHAESRP